MSCEDCKNYEVTADKEFQKMSEGINELLANRCCGLECDDCEMQVKHEHCIKNKIRVLLEGKGAKL